MKLNDPRVRTWLVGCVVLAGTGWFVEAPSFPDQMDAVDVVAISIIVPIVVFGPLAILLGGMIMAALSIVHTASGFLLQWLYATKPLTVWQGLEIWKRQRSAKLATDVTPLQRPASK